MRWRGRYAFQNIQCRPVQTKHPSLDSAKRGDTDVNSNKWPLQRFVFETAEDTACMATAYNEALNTTPQDSEVPDTTGVQSKGKGNPGPAA